MPKFEVENAMRMLDKLKKDSVNLNHENTSLNQLQKAMDSMNEFQAYFLKVQERMNDYCKTRRKMLVSKPTHHRISNLLKESDEMQMRYLTGGDQRSTSKSGARKKSRSQVDSDEFMFEKIPLRQDRKESLKKF